MTQSFRQARQTLAQRLREPSKDGFSCGLMHYAEVFLSDSRASDSIAASLVSNLLPSWGCLEGVEQFLFINRDSSVACVGFGDCCTRPETFGGPVFVSSNFEESQISTTVCPRVRLVTSQTDWPRIQLVVAVRPAEVQNASLLSEIEHILSVLDDSFIVRPHAAILPHCESSNESGLSHDECCAAITKFTTSTLSSNSPIEKVVFSRRVTFSLSCSVNPFALLLRLLLSTEKSDSGKRFVLLHKSASQTSPAFISVTPERLCAVDPNGSLTTEALAGTCKAGEFEMDDKLDHEHNTVASYITASLSELGGEVKTTNRDFIKLRDVTHCRQTFSVSPPIAGPRKSLSDLIDWSVRTLHPTPAVGGFPRVPAMELIRTTERQDRAQFAAPMGVIDCVTGVGELCVAIRSALVVGKRVDVFAGAGIVAGSDPESEWSEMGLKMNQFKSVLLERVSGVVEQGFPNNATEAVASFVIEELVRQGVATFIVCPGSRSTPLAMAVVRNSLAKERSIVVHDERCAGFYAVGIARAGGLAVIIVTSGTAVANLMPAVCEAREAGLPLVLLTADRPSRSWNVGETQTIPQSGMFKDYVGFMKNIPAPSTEAPVALASLWIKSILADVSFAVGEVAKRRNQIVHFNLEFEKSEFQPFLRDPEFTHQFHANLDTKVRAYTTRTEPFTLHCGGEMVGADSSRVMDALIRRVQNGGKILFVCGEILNPSTSIALSHFCNHHRIGCIADPTSLMWPSDYVIIGMDQVIADPQIQAVISSDVSIVIRVGGPLISAKVQEWSASLPCQWVRVLDDPSSSFRHDPQQRADIYMHQPLGEFLSSLDGCVGRIDGLRTSGGIVGGESFVQISRSMCAMYGREISKMMKQDVFNECLISAVLGEAAASVNGSVFLSASMPCRDFSLFGTAFANIFSRRMTARLVASNRGANGIDGVIASAAGFAAMTGPSFVLIGDVATLHDLGGVVLALKLHPGNTPGERRRLKIVCVNNAGGAIFSFLPVKDHKDVFTPFFDTPHALKFSAIVNGMMPGIARAVSSAVELRDALLDDGIGFIECVGLPDHTENVKLHKDVGSAVIRGIKGELGL